MALRLCVGLSLACASCTGADATASLGPGAASLVDATVDAAGSASQQDGGNGPPTPEFPSEDGGTDAESEAPTRYVPCAMGADVSVDAAGEMASDGAADGSSCRSIADWSSDPGCPADASAFSESCTSPGMHCEVVANIAPGGPPVTIHALCISPYNDVSAPVWSTTAPPSYTDCVFGQLPSDIALDDSDCATRPVTTCSCDSEGVPESAVVTTLSACAVGADMYIAFDDPGCAKDVRYDDGEMPGPDFVSCVRGALAAARWDCVGPATHLVVQRTTPLLLHPGRP